MIPFIPNFYGKTPLHYCIEGDAEETKVADYFLRDFLANSPIDHHGRAIAGIISECIEKEVPSIGSYLDARLIPTE